MKLASFLFLSSLGLLQMGGFAAAADSKFGEDARLLDGDDYDYDEFDSIDVEYETFVYVTEDVVTANSKCGLEVPTDKVETCPPTISIEQTACEAPLVVYGRVIEINKDEETSDYGAVKIQVNYKSKFFSGNPRKFIPKYGAGIDKEANGTAFYDDSSFFTTWVHGFLSPNTTVTDPIAECGTLVPSRIQEELYFFLDNLPADAGTTGVDIDPNTQELTVNLTLSSTKFRSGTAPASAWEYVDEGIFNDEIKLSGDCQAVYCCYNPDCADCEGVLEKHAEYYECPEWTIKTAESDTPESSSPQTATTMMMQLLTTCTMVLLFAPSLQR